MGWGRVFDLGDEDAAQLVTDIVHDFVDSYWSVRLDDGAPARLALYFPQTALMDSLKPVVESALAMKGIPPTVVLPVHRQALEANKRAFYRVASDPNSPHRIILLVNMGTKGWNCPSLFATALVRKLKTSNNFVLQAATRCLRQVPGNTHPARIYLTRDNKAILEKQLQETYGTSIQDLGNDRTERVEQRIELRNWQMPPLLLTKRIARYRRKSAVSARLAELSLQMPDVPYVPAASMETWTIADPQTGGTRLTRIDRESPEPADQPATLDVYSAAASLSANYHLPPSSVLISLRSAYPQQVEIPVHHLEALAQQIEAQCSQYEQDWEEVDVALALVKPEGFDQHLRSGELVYTARVSFAKDRAHLYQLPDDLPNGDEAREFSFHYAGYNFDSKPEAEYLERVLNLLGEQEEQLLGVWFTGGLSDPGKTDLFAEYLGEDGRWHRYTPDFVLQRKDGKHLVVEIKNDRFSAEVNADLARHQRGEGPISKEGRKAVALRQWQDLNPDVLHYEVIFASEALESEALVRTREFLMTRPKG